MRASPLGAFAALPHRLALRSGTASGSGHAHHLAGAVESRCQRRHPDHSDSQGQGSDTNHPSEELARALADHFRAREFEAQVFRTSGDRTVMQARKESLWRHLLGVAYALTVVVTPGEGQLSIGLGAMSGSMRR